MLFLEDPDKRPGLWASWHERLSKEAVCCVVSAGRGDLAAGSRVLDRDMLDMLEQRLRTSDIKRIGANHGNAIAPYFGLKLHEGEARITEFVTYPVEDQCHVSEEKLRRDLEILAVDLFFSLPAVRIVSVPLPLDPWKLEGAFSDSEGGILRIVSTKD